MEVADHRLARKVVLELLVPARDSDVFEEYMNGIPQETPVQFEEVARFFTARSQVTRAETFVCKKIARKA